MRPCSSMSDADIIRSHILAYFRWLVITKWRYLVDWLSAPRINLHGCTCHLFALHYYGIFLRSKHPMQLAGLL